MRENLKKVYYKDRFAEVKQPTDLTDYFFLHFSSIQIIVSCCVALLVAVASCEEVKKDTEKLQEESQNIEKRGLHGSFGGHEWSSGGDEGHGHHHHEHIKTVTIEKKYPVPYEVIKKIPYTVEKKVSVAKCNLQSSVQIITFTIKL